MRDLIPVLPNLDLYDPVRKALVSDDDLEGSSDQIRIVEFDTRTFVTVIPQVLRALPPAIRYRAAQRLRSSVLIG